MGAALISLLPGIAVTLLCAYVAQRLGWIQVTLAREAHTLNVQKALPKIGASIRLDYSYDNGKAFPPTYYLRTTIYNDGDLAASNLRGYWKLSCPGKYIQQVELQIARDFLGTATPFEMEPYKFTNRRVDAAFSGSEQISFDVDIDFTYVGLPPDEVGRYHARYTFDNQSKRMARAD
jgi:hypothetical protein